ncbi:MAG: ABC transporter ATP-binding protein/permease, partial [Clostridiales Family XIII bacterium]|nr:ABC transporter ATP-binding protein/permease [Clostridiales Family XIII bacterium]
MFKFISRLMRFSGEDAWKLKASVAISFVEGILANFPIYAALLVILKITDGTLDRGYAWTVFFMILASLVVCWALRRVFIGMQSDAACRVAARERLRIGDLFKRFPMSYFTEGNIGNVTSVITGDLSFAEDYGMTKLDDVISGLISIVIACAFLLWVDWRTAVASIVSCVLAIVAFNAIEKVTKRQAKIRQEQVAKLTGAVLEYTEGISVIKALRMSGDAAKRMDDSIEDACHHAIDFEHSMIRPVTRYLHCYAFAIAAVLFLSFWQFFNGELSLPVVVMVALFVFRIYLPAMGLAGGASMMRVMEAGLDRYEKLKEVPIIDADGKNIALTSFEIEFENVTFSYEEKET